MDDVAFSYPEGFETTLESETFPPGISHEVIDRLSDLKREPDFLRAFRHRAFDLWLTMEPPTWGSVELPAIDYQAMSYFSAPKKRTKLGSLDEVDPAVRETFDRLGIPIFEQKRLANVAVDAIFDSVSVATTFQKELEAAGVIFCSMQEAVQRFPDLVERYLGSVVPAADHFYAALNASVFSDGSFVYVPKGVKCPMDLSSYFRINQPTTGQFERTLIIADEGAEVSYLEGCTAPSRPDHQLHAAVVELIAHKDATIRYATVQNWYPGDENGRGGVLNLVTKRGLCLGERSHISWLQVEAGSAVTWKYPSCVLRGDESSGAFYSVACTKHHQQADTGTKMIHLGKRTKSTVVAKSLSSHQSRSVYRGQIRVNGGAEAARVSSQCDALLFGSECESSTYPTVEVERSDAHIEHEATTSRVSEDQLFYAAQRGIEERHATSLVIQGFCHDVLKRFPLEFAAEAQKLVELSFENSVG